MRILDESRSTRRGLLAGFAGLTGAGLVRAGVGGGAGEALATFPVPLSEIRAAFLVDGESNPLELAGPWEAFRNVQSASRPGFVLYTVAASTAAMRPGGMRLIPDCGLADAPQPQVLVIGASNSSAEAIDWITRMAATADVVMSLGAGAFALASTGLLDGLGATTARRNFEAFARAFPQVELRRDRSFVDNGKIVTAGAGTAGIDAALHVAARYYGCDVARATAAALEHRGGAWVSGVQTPQMMM